MSLTLKGHWGTNLSLLELMNTTTHTWLDRRCFLGWCSNHSVFLKIQGKVLLIFWIIGWLIWSLLIKIHFYFKNFFKFGEIVQCIPEIYFNLKWLKCFIIIVVKTCFLSVPDVQEWIKKVHFLTRECQISVQKYEETVNDMSHSDR